MNREAPILPTKSQVGSMSPVLPDAVIFREKQDIDFYWKSSRFFSICNLSRFFFENLSVDLIWPSGYQCATPRNPVRTVKPSGVGWDALRK